MTTEPAWALLAAVTEDLQRAADAVHKLVAAHGPASIVPVMMSWIDTSAYLCGFNPAPGQPVRLNFRSLTGELRPIDELAPDYVWAGRMFVARIARDRDQFAALINSLHGQDERFSAGVEALLDTCGTELRVRGFRPSMPLREDS